MSEAAAHLIEAFSALSPAERHQVILELAKIAETESGYSDDDLVRAGDELFALYDDDETSIGKTTEG